MIKIFVSSPFAAYENITVERNVLCAKLHPKTVDIKSAPYTTREKFFVAWLMELPYKCCC